MPATDESKLALLMDFENIAMGTKRAQYKDLLQRHGAGMAVLPEHAAVLVAMISADSRDHGAALSGLHQVRPLLDMHLDVRSDARSTEVALPRADRVRIVAALLHVLRERAAGVEAHDRIERRGRQDAESGAAPDIRCREP